MTRMRALEEGHVTPTAVGAPGAAGSVRCLPGLTYGPDRRHRLDLFLPAGVTSGDRRKTVLFFHGGAWSMGGTRTHRFVGRALAEKGFVAAVATYRLFPRVRFPAFVADAALAMAWMCRNVSRHGGDPDGLYLMGHSAGAHIAALLALDPRYLDAVGVHRKSIAGVVGLSGLYTFNPKAWRSLAPIFTAHPDPSARPVDFVGTVEASDHAFDGPPFLLLYGGTDVLVRGNEVPEFAAAYRAAGGQAAVKRYPRLGHGGMLFALGKGLRWHAPVLDDVAAWIGVP